MRCLDKSNSWKLKVNGGFQGLGRGGNEELFDVNRVSVAR
jgi:hypothetical protein